MWLIPIENKFSSITFTIQDSHCYCFKYKIIIKKSTQHCAKFCTICFILVSNHSRWVSSNICMIYKCKEKFLSQNLLKIHYFEVLWLLARDRIKVSCNFHQHKYIVFIKEMKLCPKKNTIYIVDILIVKHTFFSFDTNLFSAICDREAQLFCFACIKVITIIWLWKDVWLIFLILSGHFIKLHHENIGNHWCFFTIDIPSLKFLKTSNKFCIKTEDASLFESDSVSMLD